MGFFSKLGDLISKPVRGVGRIARGKFREGLGDIAGTAKYVAPFTGVGALGTAALSAADVWGDGGSLGDAAKGAVLDYGGSRLIGGALSRFTGGPDVPDIFQGELPGTHLGTQAPSVFQGAPIGSFGSRVGQQAAPSALAAAGQGAGSNIGRYIAAAADPGPAEGMTGYEKGALGLNLLGTGAGIYGAYQQGKQADREWDMVEQRESDRRRRNEAVSPIVARLLGEALKRYGR